MSFFREQLMMVVISLGALTACSADGSNGEVTTARWYATEQVDLGRALFQTHCASCHGEDAEGTTDWRMLDANGNYPPPPLNGTAHAWHHPLSVLERSIAAGGVPLGGVMPGFTGVLDEHEVRATIAYFQSFWSDEVYARWREIDAR